ncbi:flagellar hook-associated protein FlgK [Microbacterium sp. 77mftsu3.1]|uniref:flagellar hook-associated protein FlgK n=1 Tax=Microbacterium sp. 77mftsu3.1 TaxID=1761802 RepID=UPI00039E970F|nr:flagellar hook-associated protein FlgK [Microbacterium sp. 77mftsu3.1]SDH36921.1 flagellar hook-associated protein 1 FlgK [Microbacterium sp. 77mftsu3.1]
MSTFSGLSSAASALQAARQGMNVATQNIANQKTEGYTRQRVETAGRASVDGSRFTLGPKVGGGVDVTGISRLGDNVLDARVRDTLAASGFWSTKAAVAVTAEKTLAEPGPDGLSTKMNQFWSRLSDLSNTPDSAASGEVVLSNAKLLTAQIGEGYRAVSGQWDDANRSTGIIATQVNAAADEVADLNRSIRDTLAAGGSANELVDARNLLAQKVARLSGATGTVEKDGTMTLRVDGNALVSGTNARHLSVTNPTSLEQGTPTTVSWADGVPIQAVGGELGGAIAAVAPDGVLAKLAGSYNDLARSLADTVNTQHQAGVTSSGAVGGEFFTIAPGGPAAVSLSVAVTSLADLAVARPGSGAKDGSNAEAIADAGRGIGGPSELWGKVIADIGGIVSTDLGRAERAEITTVAAVSAQASLSSVDNDEETVQLMQHQTAYQAAARALTAVDEALDILINRTGLVGR